MVDSPFTPLAAEHDRRHALQPGVHARESLIACGLKLPDEGLKLSLYTWVDGEDVAGLSVAAYGPRLGDRPILDRHDGVHVGRADFDDWRVGPLHVQQDAEPFAGSTLTLDGEEISAELTFRPMHEPFSYAANYGWIPPFLAADRFEQSGYVEGRITVRGENVDVRSVGHRDHSWGTRDWGTPQHWKWVESQTETGEAVHVFEIHALGRRWVYGYVHKGGETAAVTDLTITVDSDERLVITGLEADVLDRLGRRTSLRAEAFATSEFSVHPLVNCMEDSLRVEIDGRPGAGHIEQLWPTSYLDYIRAEDRISDNLRQRDGARA